ncbi:MAG: PAS domain-containing protein, partial [Myxococcales bacterium]|nr:PAS domain-containing protein [Myxococcales bacterium]
MGSEQHSGDGPARSLLSDSPHRDALLRALYDDASYGILLTGRDGRLQGCNAAGARMIGYEVDELIGRHFNEFTHPEDARVGADKLAEMVRGERRVVEFEKRYVHRDGSIVWVRLSVSTIRGLDGEIAQFLTYVDNITADTEQRQALERSERRLSGLLEGLPCLLLCLNADGVFLDYKASPYAQLYAPPGHFLGKQVAEVLPPPIAALLRDALRETVATRRVVEVEYVIEIGDAPRDFSARLAPYGDGEVVVLVTDISERKAAERDQAARKTAIIDAQREALQQLSTPLIPIADRVIAVPLIGPIDAERAEHVTTALLAGVAAHGAQTVILDITGVPDVSGEVAAKLIAATRAIR